MMAITARIKPISTLSQLANRLVFVRTTEGPVHESSSWEGVSCPHSKEEFPEPQWLSRVTLVLLSERKRLSGRYAGAGSGNTVVTEPGSRWI